MDRNYIDRVILKKDPPADSYLFRLPAVQALIRDRELPFSGSVTFFVGENGTESPLCWRRLLSPLALMPKAAPRTSGSQPVPPTLRMYRYLTLSKSSFAKTAFFSVRRVFITSPLILMRWTAADRVAPGDRQLWRHFPAPAVTRRKLSLRCTEPFWRQRPLYSGRARIRPFPGQANDADG